MNIPILNDLFGPVSAYVIRNARIVASTTVYSARLNRDVIEGVYLKYPPHCNAKQRRKVRRAVRDKLKAEPRFFHVKGKQ